MFFANITKRFYLGKQNEDLQCVDEKLIPAFPIPDYHAPYNHEQNKAGKHHAVAVDPELCFLIKNIKDLETHA